MGNGPICILLISFSHDMGKYLLWHVGTYVGTYLVDCIANNYSLEKF